MTSLNSLSYPNLNYSVALHFQTEFLKGYNFLAPQVGAGQSITNSHQLAAQSLSGHHGKL
jgi:hypothetical protein